MKAKFFHLVHDINQKLKPHSILLMGLFYSGFSCAEIHYNINRIDSNGQLKIELQLSKINTSKERKLTTRAHALGLMEQVMNPKCDSLHLQKDIKGFWIVPPNCTQVHWTVTPYIYDDGKWNASEQLTASTKKAGWILLSEPTSLLRLVDSENETAFITADQGISLLGAIGQDKYFNVPNDDEAPEFFIVSKKKINVEIKNRDALQITYFTDNQQRAENYHLTNWHAKAIQYLSTLFPMIQHLPENSRKILVLWIGIHDQFGQIGGAAGAHSFVANYAFGDNNNETANNVRTMLIITHEQFHQLTDRLRAPNQRQVAWVEESLAQYYSLKALRHIFPQDNIEKIHADFINTSLPRKYGLIELQRQFDQGNRSNYPLFYSQGAAFWYEIDRFIQKKSQSKLSLDSFLNELLFEKSHIIEAYQLPQNFILKIMQLGKDDAQNILDRFVTAK